MKIRRATCLIAASAILMLVIDEGRSQDLKPGIRWSVDEAGSWGTDDNWTLAGSDPPESGVPGEGEVASVRNGGTAQVDSAVGDVDAVAIRDGIVDIGQGGALTVTEATVVGADGTLSIGGNGSLTTGSLANSGGLALNGKDASVNVGGNFANNGVLTLSTTGADPYSIINVAGSAALGGGTIDLATTPTGANFGFGNSWAFLKADTFSGQPSQLTVGGAAPSLDRGLGLLVGTDADGNAAVTVSSVPIAVVDRTTGDISITNPAGGAVDIKAYTLASENGLLSTEGWSSLADQGSEGWTEANPLAEQLTEVNLLGATTLGVGDTQSLGGAWGGTNVSPREEDVTFDYSLADGRVIAGTVEYAGPANDLVLSINPESGEGILQNTSASVGDFSVAGYNIVSPSGALNVAGFTGLGEDGFVIAAPTASALAEISLEASKVFSNGTAVSLGNIFTPGSAQDVQLQFGNTDFQLLPGTVEFTGGGPVVGPVCNPNTRGDIDGNGVVEFADFLTISANFGNAVADHASGDIDCNGTVEFADFLTLSANFGSTVPAASSVPEPNGAALFGLGSSLLLGLWRRRRASPTPDRASSIKDNLVTHEGFGMKNGTQLMCILIVSGLLITSQQAGAVDFDTRFIRLHPEGPNGQINSTVEARGIFDGTVIDVIKNEDLTGKLEFIDLAGGPGSFAFENLPYLNGINDESMDDFLQFVSGTLEFPAGDYSIGFGRDDGGFLNLPGISFIETFGENGPDELRIDGDGEILFNGTGGHAFTVGTFTVPEGGVVTGFEAGFFERGGGDSFEVAILDDHAIDVADFVAVSLELTDGAFDVSVTGDPFDGSGGIPGDFNADGVIDDADFGILTGNIGTAGPGGDINGDGSVDITDFADFAQIFPQPAGAASVPEPNGFSVFLLSATMLLGRFRRRERR